MKGKVPRRTSPSSNLEPTDKSLFSEGLGVLREAGDLGGPGRKEAGGVRGRITCILGGRGQEMGSVLCPPRSHGRVQAREGGQLTVFLEASPVFRCEASLGTHFGMAVRYWCGAHQPESSLSPVPGFHGGFIT